MKFENKTIWITGASSGIGEALAIEWSEYKPVLILSGRNREKLDRVKSRCEQKGASVTVIELDLTAKESIEQASSAILSSHPKIDILVNNGGISQRATVLDASVDVDRTIMETNFFGAITLTKKILPVMAKNKDGHIVVISSIVGKFGFPLRSAYSASKHALQGYFDSLRAEMTNYNVHVTMVSPGRIVTNISYNAIDKDGEKHGVMDPGQEKGMPADICAKKIIKAVKKRKKDILVGNKEVIMVHIKRFLPFLYYKLASKVSAT
jgi:short-subunit dehydrogenase